MDQAPVSDPERIVPLDMLRGVAVLGILVMNVQAYAFPDAAYVNPHGMGRIEGSDWWTWLLGHVLADTKFIDLFSMLFGAGILLFTSRLEAQGAPARRLHYRRMLWLLLFGFVHAHVFWSGDILFGYALYGMMVYPLRNLSAGRLVALAAAGTLTFVALLAAMGWSMPWWPPERIAEFRDEVWSPPPDVLEEQIDAFRGGWLSQAAKRTPDSLLVEFVFYPFFVVWKIAAMMLLGMALMKTGVLSAARSDRFYATLILAGVFVGVPVILLGVAWCVAADWEFQASMFIGKTFNHGAGVLVALAWAGLVMLTVRRGWVRSLTARLAAVGRMAFTNYIAQTLLCTTLFYGHGFGLFGALGRTQLLAVVLGIWILELAWSPWWLARFRFGPLEWAWRSLTYGARPALRRAAAAEAPAD